MSQQQQGGQQQQQQQQQYSGTTATGTPQRTPSSVGSNNPYRSSPSSSAMPNLMDLNIQDDTDVPPPPSYDAALRHSLDGTVTPAGHSQQRQPQQPFTAQTQQPYQSQQHHTSALPQQHQTTTRPLSHHSTRSNATATTSSSAATAAGVQRRSSVEDPLAPLGKYDIEIIVDDSPSMLDNGKWQDLRAALMGVAEQA